MPSLPLPSFHTFVRAKISMPANKTLYIRASRAEGSSRIRFESSLAPVARLLGTLANA